MPNWCHNRVTAYGNEDKIKEIEKIFESSEIEDPEHAKRWQR